MQRANNLPSVKNVQNVFPVFRTHNIIVELIPLNVFVCSLYVIFFIYIVKKSKNVNIFSTQVFDILPVCYLTVKNGSFHSTLSCCQTRATVHVLIEWSAHYLFGLWSVSYTTKNRVLGWWWTVVPHSHHNHLNMLKLTVVSTTTSDSLTKLFVSATPSNAMFSTLLT